MPSKILIEMQGRHYKTGIDKTFYFSDSGVTYLGINYLPLIYGGVLFSHSFDAAADGISVKLINSGLDYLREYAFSGRYIKCFISREETKDKFYLIFTGTIEMLLVENVSVGISAKSHYLAFDTIANPTVFTGVITDFEGGPELEGTVKPRLFGKCFNIKPVYVDAPNLTLGISWKKDGTRDSLTAITEVRDGGLVLGIMSHAPGSTGGDFPNAASLQAYHPNSGHYAICTAEGLVKLGSVPEYAITVDAEQSANTYEKFITLAVAETTVSKYEVDGTVSVYTIGHYITAKTSYTQLDAYLKTGLDIYNWFDAKGTLVISELNRAGTPVITFVDDDKLPLKLNEIPIYRARALGRDKPPDNIDIEYQRNYHVQSDGQVAGGVDEDKKVRYEKAVLLSSTNIPDPFDLYPIKKDVIVPTAVQTKTDADLLKAKWVGFRSDVIDLFSITVPILTNTSRYILGIVPIFHKGAAGDCITFDSTHKTFDSTRFTFDRTDAGCSIAFGKGSLNVGDLIAITSKRFNLTDAHFVIDKIVINSREMSCTYNLSGRRNL